jgi:serine protease inhibitor
MEVDRPFLYMIADEAAGMVLFIGRMSYPRSQERVVAA